MPPELLGHTLDARYRIQQRIGAGGMGIVWRAEHVQSMQPVALKTISVSERFPAAAVPRCLREARAAATLRSKHVVRVLDVQPHYVHDGSPMPYIAMELLDGLDFESLLEKRHALSFAEVSWAIGQLCVGMAIAHERGIVHRDLKPSNLFLANEDDGETAVKICDFGLAKLAQAEFECSSHSTESGMLLGTPRYMAPEQFQGKSQISGATDQWAIGLITFRMLAGVDYFEGAQNVFALSQKIVSERLRAPSSVSPRIPKAFDGWFFRACNRDPNKRYANVREQSRALAAILGPPEAIRTDVASLNSAPIGSLEARDRAHLMSEQLRARPRLIALAVAAVLSVVGALALRNYLLGLTKATAAGARRSLSQETSPSTDKKLQAQVHQLPVAADPKAPITAPSRMVSLTLPVTPLSQKTPSLLPVKRTRKPNGVVHTNTASSKLSSGAVCERSAQCTSALCIANHCQ